MALLTPIQTLWAAAVAPIGPTARLFLTWLDNGSGGGTPVLSIHNTGSAVTVDIKLTTALITAADIVTQRIKSTKDCVTIDQDSGQHRIDRTPLVGMDPATRGPMAASAMRNSSTAWLDGSSFSGNAYTVNRFGDYVFLSAQNGDGITVYQCAGDGALTRLSRLDDTASLSLDTISAMTSVTTAGGNYLLTTSLIHSDVVVMRIGSGGTLTPVAQIGPADLLPISEPTQIGAVDLNGAHFVLLGSFGSSSITVMRLGDDGAMTFVDQVIDSRDSRFAGLSAMDVISVEGQVFVAAAGNDGGVTLFHLLPSGRLLQLDTLIDDADTALQNILDLRFAMVAGRLELYVLDGRDQGITRILVDPGHYGGGTTGIISTATTGTSGNDVLSAPKGGAWVKAGAGDDTLIGGAGADTLEGGTGADLYIPLTSGTGKLVLQGFDPQEDHIDLSGFALLHSVKGLDILSTANGAVIRIGTVEITLIAGRSLSVAEVAGALLFNSDHLLTSETIMPASHATTDSAGAFRFLYVSGAHSYTGTTGSDCVTYADAPSAAVINLANQSLNAGSALGHILNHIENLEGSGFNDTFTGDALANALSGGAGNDWITPGAGNDTVDGGSGVDMVSYVDATARVVVDLAAHTGISGGATDVLLNIENVTGSVFSDLITGDAGVNRLRGLGDYDWLVGSGGGDVFDGGTGRDTIAYSAAAGSVTASLLAKAGTLGQAVGDSYISIENLTGSSYADSLTGDNDRNILRGLAGDDFIFGLDGNDTIDGGAGRDTIDGGRGNDRITGGRGNDAMDGGLGWDTAIYSGKKADYTITYNADHSISVLHLAGGTDGVDVLINIEALQFSDGRLFV